LAYQQLLPLLYVSFVYGRYPAGLAFECHCQQPFSVAVMKIWKSKLRHICSGILSFFGIHHRIAGRRVRRISRAAKALPMSSSFRFFPRRAGADGSLVGLGARSSVMAAIFAAWARCLSPRCHFFALAD